MDKREKEIAAWLENCAQHHDYKAHLGDNPRTRFEHAQACRWIAKAIEDGEARRFGEVGATGPFAIPPDA